MICCSAACPLPNPLTTSISALHTQNLRHFRNRIEEIPIPADKPTTSGKRSKRNSDGGFAMGSQFNWYVGDDTTVPQNRETDKAPASNLPGSNQSGQASQFASEFHQLLGEGSEPDPLFFIETWTLGTPAAIENFKLRQSLQADHHTHRSGDLGPAYVTNHQFFNAIPTNWSVFTSVHTVATESCNPASAYQYPLRQDQSAAENLSIQDEALPITLDDAYRILGLTPTSTLSQIKSAHRQLVIEWHPDRHQNESEEVRLHSTRKMATINGAYSILRNHFLLHSA